MARIYPFFLTHAGCPHRCLFCNQRQISAADDIPGPEQVAGFLQGLQADGLGAELAYYGGTFTLLPADLQEGYLRAAEPFLRRKILSGIRVSTRPDALSDEVVARLRGHGVTTVEIGAQSFSAEVLARSGRGHGPHEAAGAMARLRRAGIAVGLQLMPGLPGGDRAEARASLGRALELRPDFLRLYPAVVLRDSGLELLWRSGAFEPLGLDEAVELGAEMLWRCLMAGVPVIRFGLQGNEALDGGQAVLSGPYHPAFGQLVRSRLWLRGLQQAVRRGARGPVVHPADLADALGHRRENLHRLQDELGAFNFTTDAELPRQNLLLDGRRHRLVDLILEEGWNLD